MINKTIFAGVVIAVLTVSLVASTMNIADVSAGKHKHPASQANDHISDTGREHMSDAGKMHAGVDDKDDSCGDDCEAVDDGGGDFCDAVDVCLSASGDADVDA